ncbi:ECs_2282 family putative zinc-binding protein [Pantoea sp. y20]
MKLNPEKYKRNVALLCPVCGNPEMEYTEEPEVVKCTNCGIELTKDELIQENGSSIDAHVNEIKKELSKDIQKQFSNIFKKNSSN